MEAATLRTEKVPDLHNEMVRKFSREIAPCKRMMDDWNNLLQLFSNDAPLSNVQIDSISSVGVLVGDLFKANYIRYEDYEPFAKKLADVFPRMAVLVRQYAQEIMKQIGNERGGTGNDQNEKDPSPKLPIVEKK